MRIGSSSADFLYLKIS